MNGKTLSHLQKNNSKNDFYTSIAQSCNNEIKREFESKNN